MTRQLFLFLIVVASTSVYADQPQNDFVVFGDSLSDSGNLFAETGTFTVPPFELVPDAPYAIGGHHFSNGRTWIEQLATGMHTPRSARPATRSPRVFTNYAFGRSRARAGAPVFPMFDLTTQVDLFLGDFGSGAPLDATYVVWSGSNDVRDALSALLGDPSGATSATIIGDAVNSIFNNLFVLYNAGARKFLVLNVPNIGSTPAVHALAQQNPLLLLAARQMTVSFNDGIAAALSGLESLDDIEILRLDSFTLLDGIVADPEAFGFENATDACLTFGVVGGAICPRPNSFLFWDGAHPTVAAHGVLADAAEELLAP